MKTTVQTLSSLLSVVIWADGEFDEVERQTIEEIAIAFELPSQELIHAVEATSEEVAKLDEDAVIEYYRKHVADVPEQERPLIYEALLQLVSCDGVLAEDEIYNLLELALALGLGREQAVLAICDLIKHEPDLELEFA